MKETLYRFLGERNPRAKARYEALRQAGAPRWKAAPALLLPGGGGARPLPVGAGESAQSLGEPPAALVQWPGSRPFPSTCSTPCCYARWSGPRRPSLWWGPSWAIPISSGCGWRRNAAPGTRSAAAPAAGK